MRTWLKKFGAVTALVGVNVRLIDGREDCYSLSIGKRLNLNLGVRDDCALFPVYVEFLVNTGDVVSINSTLTKLNFILLLNCKLVIL